MKSFATLLLIAATAHAGIASVSGSVNSQMLQFGSMLCCGDCGTTEIEVERACCSTPLLRHICPCSSEGEPQTAPIQKRTSEESDDSRFVERNFVATVNGGSGPQRRSFRTVTSSTLPQPCHQAFLCRWLI